MTGKELSKLMGNSKLNNAIAKHARRYSNQVEDQEEYIQEAWLRIASQEGGLSVECYSKEGGRAVVSAYMRGRYHDDVKKKKSKNLNGNSNREVKKNNEYIHLGREKYLKVQRETLGGWYYEGEWEDWLYFRNGNYSILKRDADHHEVPYDDSNKVTKSFAKKYRVNNIEVLR